MEKIERRSKKERRNPKDRRTIESSLYPFENRRSGQDRRKVKERRKSKLSKIIENLLSNSVMLSI